MHRRAYLTAAGTAGLATTAGCLGKVPVVGSLLSSCGPAEQTIESVRNGGYAGQQATVRGKLDYTLSVSDAGITAFRIDGETGNIAVFLAEPPDRNIDFGDCLTVRGTVRSEHDSSETDGPVIVDATLQ